MNKHKGKRRVQKRPNYKNVGEEDEEEKGPAEDAQEDAEKTKGTEGGSKGIRTSGESEGECARECHPAACAASQAIPCVWSLLCVRGHFCPFPTPVYLILWTQPFPGSCGKVPCKACPHHTGDLEQGSLLRAPCLSIPISKKRLPESIYFVILRIE